MTNSSIFSFSLPPPQLPFLSRNQVRYLNLSRLLQYLLGARNQEGLGSLAGLAGERFLLVVKSIAILQKHVVVR